MSGWRHAIFIVGESGAGRGDVRGLGTGTRTGKGSCCQEWNQDLLPPVGNTGFFRPSSHQQSKSLK